MLGPRARTRKLLDRISRKLEPISDFLSVRARCRFQNYPASPHIQLLAPHFKSIDFAQPN